MKFIIKEKVQVAVGSQRTIRKFAWLPVRILNEIRWLEFVNIQQIFTREPITHYLKSGRSYQTAKDYWKKLKFIDNEEM